MLNIDKISMQKQGNRRRVTHRKYRKGKKSIRDTSMMGGNQNNGFPQPPTNMLNIAAARVAMNEARMPRPPRNMLNIAAARQIAMQAAIMPEVPRNMLYIPAAQAPPTSIQKNRKTRKNKRKF
jgi:hypothetical protein